jgi:hypothetical protein
VAGAVNPRLRSPAVDFDLEPDRIAHFSLTHALRASAASVFPTALALGLATQIALSIDVTNHERNPDSDRRRKLCYLSVFLRISRLMRNLNGEM